MLMYIVIHMHKLTITEIIKQHGIGIRQSGFTIVELLIVIVVIGILAAIVIVAYNGVLNRANDTTVKNDLENISKQLQLQVANSSNGVGPSIYTAFNFTQRVNKSAYMTGTSTVSLYNLMVCSNSSTAPTQYAIGAISKSGKQFYILAGGGVQEYTATTWGVNYAAATICTDMSTAAGASTAYTVVGAGYSSNDSSAGPWRTWVGGN